MLSNRALHLFDIALPVNTSRFEAGDGPILLNNVACNKSHLNLFQCVHPQSIGIHECEEDNNAGVICHMKDSLTIGITLTTVSTTSFLSHSTTTILSTAAKQ